MNIFGAVRRVASMLSNVVFNREVEDTATALFQFESGTCGVLTVTHAAGEPRDGGRSDRQPRGGRELALSPGRDLSVPAVNPGVTG